MTRRFSFRQAALALFLGAALMAIPARSQAHVYDRDDSDHPLRVVAYLVHPFGMAVEYGILRPIHWLVSQDQLDKVFGHEPNREAEANTYFEWK